MRAETVLIKCNTDKPQPGQSCLNQSRPRQLSLHRLKPLLNFCASEESLRFISEWPIRIYLYFVIFVCCLV